MDTDEPKNGKSITGEDQPLHVTGRGKGFSFGNESPGVPCRARNGAFSLNSIEIPHFERTNLKGTRHGQIESRRLEIAGR
jgi:hypothetical protein